MAYPDFSKKSVDYDHYWRTRFGEKYEIKLNSFQMERLKFIESHIEAGTSLLDIGAGDGGMLRLLKESKKIIAFATDVSDVALEHLKKNQIEAQKLLIKSKQDIIHLPQSDYVCALEVLEHLPNAEEILSALLEKANRGVFFSFPNTGYIRDRLRLLIGRFPVQWKAHPGEHLRFWTYKDLRWWLGELGLLTKAQLHLYEGVPLLNKICPGLFARAIIVKVTK